MRIKILDFNNTMRILLYLLKIHILLLVVNQRVRGQNNID